MLSKPAAFSQLETRMYELLGSNAIRSCNLGRSRLIEYASLKAFVKQQLDSCNAASEGGSNA
jgi:hypothetical protein